MAGEDAALDRDSDDFTSKASENSRFVAKSPTSL